MPKDMENVHLSPMVIVDGFEGFTLSKAAILTLPYPCPSKRPASEIRVLCFKENRWSDITESVQYSEISESTIEIRIVHFSKYVTMDIYASPTKTTCTVYHDLSKTINNFQPLSLTTFWIKNKLKNKQKLMDIDGLQMDICHLIVHTSICERPHCMPVSHGPFCFKLSLGTIAPTTQGNWHNNIRCF